MSWEPSILSSCYCSELFFSKGSFLLSELWEWKLFFIFPLLENSFPSASSPTSVSFAICHIYFVCRSSSLHLKGSFIKQSSCVLTDKKIGLQMHLLNNTKTKTRKLEYQFSITVSCLYVTLFSILVLNLNFYHLSLIAITILYSLHSHFFIYLLSSLLIIPYYISDFLSVSFPPFLEMYLLISNC